MKDSSQTLKIGGGRSAAVIVVLLIMVVSSHKKVPEQIQTVTNLSNQVQQAAIRVDGQQTDPSPIWKPT